MSPQPRQTAWQRWMRQPHTLPLRKLLLTIHTWTGLIAGLYVVVVTLTGSVLVYRNELYRTFSPEPVFVEAGGIPLSEASLTERAQFAYPDWEVRSIELGAEPHQAAKVMLHDGTGLVQRLMHPNTGEDMGNAIPFGFRATAWLLDLHDNLLGGTTGRKVNGVGAVAVIVLCMTGAVIWWPGKQNWKRNMTVDLRGGSARFVASVHKALGFCVFAFILMWGVTGTYLAFPTAYAEFFEYVQPLDPDDPQERTVDKIEYWLAYLHFGRLGGRGISWCDRGLCNSITMGTWAAVALAPTVLFVTGFVMWWRSRTRRDQQKSQPRRSAEPGGFS